MPTPTQPETDTPDTLSPADLAVIDLFVRAADLIGIPKSVGQVYGCLYATTDPLCLDQIQTRLQISKGSTSQALQFLKRVQAVRPVLVPGDRRDFYTPELQLKKMVAGFLNQQVIPHLESGKERIAQIEQLADRDLDPQRLNTLKTWHRKAEQLLPLVGRVLK
ncbi:MAG: GbsR/MarR family transcriptional regulator [Opitutales bacterium]